MMSDQSSGWQPNWGQPDAGSAPQQDQPSYPPPPAGYAPPQYGAPQDYQPQAQAQPAAWWRRLVAIILDGILLAVPIGILGAVAGLSTVETDPFTDEVTIDQAALSALSFLSIIIGLVYSGLMEGGPRGATVGKMAMRIRVVDIDSGGPIGFGKAALRRFIYNILFYLLFVPGLINALSPLWDKRGQAWHDKAVNSVVIDA